MLLTLASLSFTHNFSWDSHIRSVESKASRTLGFLKRNLKGAPYHLRALAYTSMVQSTMDYAGAIWDPHQKTKADKLERVHNRAARWALRQRHTGAASVGAMLSELGWSTMSERRRRQRLLLVWKVMTGAVDIKPEEVGLQRAEDAEPTQTPSSSSGKAGQTNTHRSGVPQAFGR